MEPFWRKGPMRMRKVARLTCLQSSSLTTSFVMVFYRRTYARSISAEEVLNGAVRPEDWCQGLLETISAAQGTIFFPFQTCYMICSSFLVRQASIFDLNLSHKDLQLPNRSPLLLLRLRPRHLLLRLSRHHHYLLNLRLSLLIHR
jgi:hypothetical protein